ncbi:MAG: hypothetical protein HFI93_04095 [Lachnospiraceae bacterium]|nr:hypothetical protein [Lachnospiraceae bacterium]
MAKKRGGGARVASRAEREARLRKTEPFGPKRFLKEQAVQLAVTLILMIVFCQLAEYFLHDNYMVPGMTAFVVVQIFNYFRMARKAKAVEEVR